MFGRGVSKAIPRDGLRLSYSRRSGRVKLVFLSEELFATVKPNGSMALSIAGAKTLARSLQFRESCVAVGDDAAQFVRGGRSVFCKFVERAGKNVLPGGEVAVVNRKGEVLGVGMATVDGKFMRQFKSGVAVKVREGLKE